MRREGYRPAIADIKLDLGAVADVTLEPQIDAAEVASSGGNLVVTVSESDALISVDGHPPEPLAGPIRLPAGPHHLTLTRAGFEPSELDVSIARGATFNTTVNLQATADTRDAYLARIHERHIWGWTTAGVGVAALATGVVLLVTGHSALNSANDNLNVVDMEFARGGGGICDQSQDVSKPMCDALLADANQRVSDAKTRMIVGYVVGGVGVAAAVVGAVVLLHRRRSRSLRLQVGVVRPPHPHGLGHRKQRRSDAARPLLDRTVGGCFPVACTDGRRGPFFLKVRPHLPTLWAYG